MHEILDVVNEQDEVIGTAERSVAHAEGLKIRLVYVWFYTPDGKIVMQRRHSSKKAYPNKLVCAVSGHVESGLSYEDAAVKEAFEETGVRLSVNDLHCLGKTFSVTHGGHSISAAFRMVYLYRFEGSVEDLRIEPNEGAGFEAWEAADLLAAFEEKPDYFTAFTRSEASTEIIRKVMELSR